MTTATATKTSPGNLTLFYSCYFAIIPKRSTSTKNDELSRNQIGRSGVQVNKENEKFTAVRSRSPQNLECGHSRCCLQRTTKKCTKM